MSSRLTPRRMPRPPPELRDEVFDLTAFRNETRFLWRQLGRKAQWGSP